MPFIIPANTLASGGFEVANSLRFNRGSSDFLNKTLGTPTDIDKATFSTWIKFSDVTSSNDTAIFAATADGNNTTHLEKLGSQVFRLNMREGSSYIGVLTTNRKFRDPSAWYHIVVAFDTTQGTGSNRVKLYVNGVQETSFSTATYPTQNVDLRFNTSGQVFRIGHRGDAGNYPDAYFAETVFVDGLQLAADSFGEFDEDSGIWKPIKVSGLTFGDNGSYLEFKGSGTSANASGMGADTSGNTNHFTVNNLTAIDQSIDTCTNNFCTLNPLQIGPRNNQADSAGTFSEGNLNVLMTGSGDDFAGTIAVSTGKWFYEVKLLTAANHGAGFTLLTDFTDTTATASNAGIVNKDFQYGSAEGGSGSKIANNGNTDVAPQNNFDDNDIIGFAFDIDGGTLKIYNNGSLDRTISSIPAGTYIPIGGDDSSTDANLAFNFGSPAYAISSSNADGNGFGNFEFAVPSGYFALCTKNLAEYG